MTRAAAVLVVDDEPDIRELLAQTLCLAGFDVSCAATGIEAMQRLGGRAPDVVVLDVLLPDLDGFEIARMMRRAGHGMPVLFLTAPGAADRCTGPAGEADACVAKPFSLEEVVLRVRALLGRTRDTDAPPPRPDAQPHRPDAQPHRPDGPSAEAPAHSPVRRSAADLHWVPW
ncbi:response regulator [Streptomyces sp. NBC_00306]|uniref:response regulator n=1 Tax=Streptomyces sp. NBC_00306 TaxID=2975708 RepID=UPI002E29700D|nr:response regulator [Streptomyces sp. NBC_00306]